MSVSLLCGASDICGKQTQSVGAHIPRKDMRQFSACVCVCVYVLECLHPLIMRKSKWPPTTCSQSSASRCRLCVRQYLFKINYFITTTSLLTLTSLSLVIYNFNGSLLVKVTLQNTRHPRTHAQHVQAAPIESQASSSCVPIYFH